jgi:hypothetical protein
VRFRLTGQTLADSLAAFSLDVVGIVASYAVIGGPTPGATPVTLTTFGSQNGGDHAAFRVGCAAFARCPDGTVWVTQQRQICIVNNEDKVLPSVVEFQFSWGCTGMAFDTNGQVFFTDVGADQVVACRWRDGHVTRVFGETGALTGQFSRPFGIAVDGQGLLYVTDQCNSRVQVFQRNGTFVRQIGGAGANNGQFSMPLGIAFSAAGELWVCDAHNHRLQVWHSMLAHVCAFLKRCLSIYRSTVWIVFIGLVWCGISSSRALCSCLHKCVFSCSHIQIAFPDAKPVCLQ